MTLLRTDGTRGAVRRMRRSALVERMRASLWFLPTVMVAMAALAAAALNLVHIGDRSPLRHLVFPGGADGARGILETIAGSVITVTGVVFSLTVVTLQLASSQFSPRLLRTFLRDVSNQVVLGVFLATFAYALLVLRAVETGATPEQDVVPAAAVTFAYVLAAASVAALVYFIDHISRVIRIDSLMREVNEDTGQVIEDLYVNGTTPVIDARDVPVPPPGATAVPADRSGFVQSVDLSPLLRCAAAVGIVVSVQPLIGQRVVEGGPLALAWRERGEAVDPSSISLAVQQAVQIGYERTAQQDVAFGFRQLVDVAIKALSPGVNDPTTAVHALSHLAALLVHLTRQPLGARVHRDEETDTTLVIPGMELPAYLDLACGQIRRYGASDPVVALELVRMLVDVARCPVTEEHRDAIRREADMVLAAAERAVPEPRDLEPLQAAHRELVDLLRGDPDGSASTA